MYQKKIPDENLCPFEYAMSLFKGKWDIRIICLLAHNNALRYGEFKDLLPEISDTALSAVLKKLTGHRIIHRAIYDELPPRVEYSLSPRGLKAVPILQNLCRWSSDSCETEFSSRLTYCEDCKYGQQKNSYDA